MAVKARNTRRPRRVTTVRGARRQMNRTARSKVGRTRRFGGNVYTRRRVRISRGQTRQQFRRQTQRRLSSMTNPSRRRAYRQRRRVLFRRTH